MHTSVSSNSEVTTLHKHSPVDETTLREIAAWMEEGCTMNDLVARLRPKTVPPGYSTTEWKKGLFFQIHVYILLIYYGYMMSHLATIPLATLSFSTCMSTL